MKRPARAVAYFACLLLIPLGCTHWRWSGGRAADDVLKPETPHDPIAVSSGTRPVGEPIVVREPFDDSLYYGDLGPDTIDVSGYPTQQQMNYKRFAVSCARCHTLARAINTPAQSRLYWQWHLARMRVHARISDETPLDAQEIKEVLDFLEFDARERKVVKRAHFLKQQEALRARFDQELARRLEILQRDARGRGGH